MSIRRYKRCLAFYSSSAYLSAFAYKSIHRNRPDWLDDQWVDIEFYQRVIVCYRVFGDGDDSVDHLYSDAWSEIEQVALRALEENNPDWGFTLDRRYAAILGAGCSAPSSAHPRQREE